VVDGEAGFFISAYNQLETAKEYNTTAIVFKLLGIDSEFKYLLLMDIVGHIKGIFSAHEQGQLEKAAAKHGNQYRC